MPYEYESVKEQIFTDEGQRRFLKLRDGVIKMLATAGAVRMASALKLCDEDDWFGMACIDRMVELGEIKEIARPASMGQGRVFVPVMS